MTKEQVKQKTIVDRQYLCYCSKMYKSYAGLYLHLRTKHKEAFEKYKDMKISRLLHKTSPINNKETFKLTQLINERKGHDDKIRDERVLIDNRREKEVESGEKKEEKVEMKRTKSQDRQDNQPAENAQEKTEVRKFQPQAYPLRPYGSVEPQTFTSPTPFNQGFPVQSQDNMGMMRPSYYQGQLPPNMTYQAPYYSQMHQMNGSVNSLYPQHYARPQLYSYPPAYYYQGHQPSLGQAQLIPMRSTWLGQNSKVEEGRSERQARGGQQKVPTAE